MWSSSRLCYMQKKGIKKGIETNTSLYHKFCNCFLNSYWGNVVQAACTKTLTPKEIFQTSSCIEDEKLTIYLIVPLYYSSGKILRLRIPFPKTCKKSEITEIFFH